MSAMDEYREWCTKHYRESVGFDLADAAIAELEAELAKRDRMLRLAWKEGHLPIDSIEIWLAALRARAEEGIDEG